MTRKIFENIRKENRAALVTFLSCGDPNIEFTGKLVKAVCEAGADIVELGVPFSDPMADGHSIQAADVRALASSTTLSDVFEMSRNLRSQGVDKGFVLFPYFNPIFKYGIDRAFKKAAECGIDAFLVVDLPMEEFGEINTAALENGIEIIPLSAPTTPIERVRKISKAGSGFLYYVTVSGVTGARKNLPEHFVSRMSEIRNASVLPVAAGFGISTPEMAHQAALCADAVVVGSKIVDLAHETLISAGEQASIKVVANFVSSLAGTMKR